MSVRFAQLPLGAMFRWQECCYRKVSPLEALDAVNDGRRLIPRSTKVEPLGDPNVTGNDRGVTSLDRDAVEVAVDTCFARLRERLSGLLPEGDDIRQASLHAVLQSEHADLLGRLKIAAAEIPSGDASADAP